MRQFVAIISALLIASTASAGDLPNMSFINENTLLETFPLGKANKEQVLDAYARRDVPQAMEVWRGDEEIDAVNNSLFRELLTYMMEDPRNIGLCTHLLFAAKNIERVGDHTTNIAEDIHYLVHGVALTDDRPKGDDTASTLIRKD